MMSEQMDMVSAPGHERTGLAISALPASCWPRPGGVLASMKVSFSANSANQSMVRQVGALISGKFRVGGKWVYGSFLLDTGAMPMFLGRTSAEQSAGGPVTGESEISFHAHEIVETVRVDADFEFHGASEQGDPVVLSFSSPVVVTPSIISEPPVSTVGVIGREVLSCGNLTYDGQSGWWHFTVDVASMRRALGDSVSVVER